MRLRVLILPLLLAVSLSACNTTMGGPKQTGGAILGGAGGAFAGSQFGKGNGQIAMTAVGTLLGAFIGSEIGASLDRADQIAVMQAQQQAVAFTPPYQQVAWQNPQTGNHGYTVAGPAQAMPLTTGGSAYCREYQTTITVGGKSQQAYGTACQGPDGQWRIAN